MTLPSLLARLERDHPRTILVLGASDTGKTTVIERLLQQWQPMDQVAVVDCDVGQSRLGPPTTIGWGLARRPCAGWSDVPLRGIVFTGAVSPEENVEVLLDSVSRMAVVARGAASIVLFDTTGLVEGPAGLALKRRKIELLRPDLIIALQRQEELEPILGAIGPVPIQRLAADPTLPRRSLAQRSTYRSRQLARYFANASLHTLSSRSLQLVGLGPEWRGQAVTTTSLLLADRLVSLRDGHGEDLALGWVREADSAEATIRLLSPLRELGSVQTVSVGSVRWPEPAL